MNLMNACTLSTIRWRFPVIIILLFAMTTTASAAPTFQSVSAGGSFSCALTTAGFAFCWGTNTNGQLGDGTTTNSNVPVAVLGGPTYQRLIAGMNHICGTSKQTGAAFCWGANTVGKLGNDSLTSSNVPIEVSGGRNYRMVAAGANHTCGVTATIPGVAYCWGNNNGGQLGDGTTTNSNVPVAVLGGLNFGSVSAGSLHTCGATGDGTAYCWGSNSNNRLGHGGPVGGYSSVPVVVSGGLAFLPLSVSAGSLHTCGVTFGRAAYCWGTGGYGALGDGTNLNRNVPVAVLGGLNFGSVSAGSTHSCGLTLGGAAYCWGLNNIGQLGDGTNTNSNVPVAVSGGLTFQSMSAPANGSTTCGVADGAVYCWGNNGGGQLGDGTTTSSNVPVLVDVTNVAEPLIDPVVGNFNTFATNAGEAQVSEISRLLPFTSFSKTVASGLATSQVDINVTNNSDGSSLIALTNLMDVQLGGSEAGVSFATQFDVFQDATYEIFGGMLGSSAGTPEAVVQLQTGIQFNKNYPFTVLLHEGDNSAPFDKTPPVVDFTFNGVNEGTIGGNLPSGGSLTGVLAPGRYSLDGTTWIFSRGGGFSANAITDISIRLTPTGSAPGAEPPTAEAGVNVLIHAGQRVALNGNGSFDDLTPSEDLLYSWNFVSVPVDSSLLVLDDASTIMPSFMSDLPGEYVVSLVVTDQNGLSSAPDTVTVSSLNVPPTADAGMGQGAIVGGMVSLDGSASSDADFDAITFSWALTDKPVGSTATLTDANTDFPYFVPDLPGIYVAQLIVNDGFADSTPDDVTITAITAESFAEMNVMDAINAIGALPPGSVTTKGNQTALGQHLSQIISALQKDNLAKAIMKLTETIERTDGCALRGAPDLPSGGGGTPPAQDYITDCAEQAIVYALLTDVLAALSP